MDEVPGTGYADLLKIFSAADEYPGRRSHAKTGEYEAFALVGDRLKILTISHEPCEKGTALLQHHRSLNVENHRNVDEQGLVDNYWHPHGFIGVSRNSSGVFSVPVWRASSIVAIIGAVFPSFHHLHSEAIMVDPLLVFERTKIFDAGNRKKRTSDKG